ncbi:hypothetical protein V8F20_008152 [Naviculisporaceae sp. PSN 640]
MASDQPPTELPPWAYESRAHVPVIAVAATLTLATIAVSLRTYTRACILRHVGLDDYAAIVALLFALGSGSMVASNGRNGAGKHIMVVPPELIPEYFKTFWISIVLYNFSLWAIKMAFLFQYYRVFSSKRMRTYICLAGVLIIVWSISQILVVIFTCVPVHRFWLPETPGVCVELVPFWYANAAGNIVTDVIVFLLPLPVIKSLNLRKPQKILLLGIFGLGFFTCAISIIRIQYLKLSPDTTWDNVNSSCWSISELCSGIVCCCLPTLRPLLSRLVPALQSRGAASGYVYDAKGQSSSSGGTGGGSKGNNKRRSRAAVMYPEDVELQATESEERLNLDTAQNGFTKTWIKPPSPPLYPPEKVQSPGHGHMMGMGLGMGMNDSRPTLHSDFGETIRPRVHTEIRAATPTRLGSPGRRPRPLEGIAVQRDVTLTR